MTRRPRITVRRARWSLGVSSLWFPWWIIRCPSCGWTGMAFTWPVAMRYATNHSRLHTPTVHYPR